MATLLQQIENLKKLKESNLEKKLFEAFKSVEDNVIQANKDQLSKGEDVFGKTVGVYAPSTENYALFDNPKKSKKEGDPYNFEWTGDFFDGFKLAINNNEVTILSNVQGSEGKIHFLTTNNLYGLNDENLKTVIREDILPFIHKFVRDTLNI